MRFFLMGDVMGKAGRRCLSALLPKVRQEVVPDAIMLNGENAAGGYGLTWKIYEEMTQNLGINCITMGNHWPDKREIYDYLPRADRLVLPANMMNISDENHGLKIITLANGKRFAVVNLIGRTFMHADNRCPFTFADRLLDRVPDSVKIRIVDFHGEATSEKQAVAQYLSGRVSVIYGTHSHVPTADERIFTTGTGFATDVGMTGPYDSVIGIRKDAAINRLRSGEKKNFEPAVDDPWLCALIADVDEASGKCIRIERVRWELKSFQGAESSGNV